MGLKADAVSRQAGTPDAIRNMRRAVKEGRDGVSTKTIAALAPVLKTTPAWLLGAEEGTPSAMVGSDVDRLAQERDRLVEQVGILTRKIEGIDVALTILRPPVAPQPARRTKIR